MIYYVSKVFTTSVCHRRLVRVRCDRCGTNYSYILTRTARGEASAPYLIGQNSAARRSVDSAQKLLADRLANDAELVPCVNCHWVNEDLVVRYRNSMFDIGAKGFSSLVIVLGFITAWVAGFAFMSNASQAPVILGVGLLITAGAPLLVGCVRRAWRMRLNPNDPHLVTNRPLLPPGTPLALLERESATGVELVPVPREPDPTESHTGWVVFHPGELVFPPRCFCCLADASTTRMHVRADKEEGLSVPVCEACFRRNKFGGAMKYLAVWTGAFTVVTALAFALIRDLHMRAAFISIFGVLAAWGGSVPVARSLALISTQVVSARRGVFKVKVKNREYNGLLIAANREALLKPIVLQPEIAGA